MHELAHRMLRVARVILSTEDPLWVHDNAGCLYTAPASQWERTPEQEEGLRRMMGPKAKDAVIAMYKCPGCRSTIVREHPSIPGHGSLKDVKP